MRRREFIVGLAGAVSSASSRVRRRPLGSWPEFVCAESTRDYVGRTINLPRADKLDSDLLISRGHQEV
jgi:hypothetical protein